MNCAVSVADLVEALRDAKNNQRLIFPRNVLQSRGIHPERDRKLSSVENLRRVMQEQNTIRKRFDEAVGESDQERSCSGRADFF